MNPELENSVKEIAGKLPIEVVEAINNTPWVEKIKQIAKDNNLDEEKENLFAIETTLLVFGTESPTNYPDNLAENVGLDDDAVVKIAKEVDEQILGPILKAVGEKISATETLSSNLPMVEEGEVAHDARPLTPERSDGEQVPHVEEPSKPRESARAPLPDYRYAGGKDPYREPLV